jgi:hypothetical protein
MSSSDCFRNARPCTYGDCHRGAAHVMYQYRGAYCWATDKVYACPEHVEQLAVRNHATSSDICPYDDTMQL